MEEKTLRRAADTINALLLAHVDDTESHEIDVYDAMAIRDDLRGMVDSLEESDEYDVPNVGDVLHDPESNPKFGSGEVRISEVTGDRADEHIIEENRFSPDKTVAGENPGHPEDAPVVKAKYVDGSNKEYAFPVTRLE